MSHKKSTSKESHGRKVANDTNKAGAQPATQKNEAKRTPESRHDRESQAGSNNQTQSRRGGKGH